MNFLPDVYVTCEVCHGRRYNAETLAVRYKGHNINDVLNLPASDALRSSRISPDTAETLDDCRSRAGLRSAGSVRDDSFRWRGAENQAGTRALETADRANNLYIG